MLRVDKVLIALTSVAMLLGIALSQHLTPAAEAKSEGEPIVSSSAVDLRTDLGRTAQRDETPTFASSATLGDTLTLELLGLPVGAAANMYLVLPVAGGGYHREQFVGSGTSATIAPNLGFFVEAAPFVVNSGERYMPDVRFQPANPGRLTVRYAHEFLVTVGRWSHGPLGSSPFGKAVGATSMETQWIRDGSVREIVATAPQGWHFDHWSVIGPDATADLTVVTSRSSRLTFTVNQPLRIVAAFFAN